MKYLHVIHPTRTLPAGTATAIGAVQVVLQENPDRVGLWIFPRDNDAVLCQEVDQQTPNYLLKGGATNVGLGNQYFGDTPVCHQGRIYMAAAGAAAVKLDIMELVRESGGLGASPP